jgi:hypothetical protein
MTKIKKAKIGGEYRIPVDDYNPVKPYIIVEFEKDEDETDEEFFAKSYDKFNNIKEAIIALEVEKRSKIDDRGGLVNYAYKLMDDLREDSEIFRNAFFNLIRNKSKISVKDIKPDDGKREYQESATLNKT